MKIKKIINNFLKIIIGVIILLVFFLAGAYFATKNKVVSSFAEKEVLYLGKIIGKYDKKDNQWMQNVEFDLYWDVWNLIKNEYTNKNELTDKELFYGSLEGLVSSLNDPYSEFLDPQKNKEFEEDMSGTFEGIGAEIGIRDDLLTIISPIDGTPAQTAGVMAGDKILEINGESTQNMNIDEAVSKIKGPKGTEVVLSIFRKGFDDIKEIKIIRDVISIKSVSYEKLENNLFLIKVSAFNGDTNYLFSQAVKEFLNQESKGLIIDLRNNPGGYLEVAIMMLGEWINKEIAVIEKFADGKTTEYLADGLNRLENYSTVVLINEGSASASEILAGALKDYNKATIIGEQSYGKGSVQMIKDLKDGSALKITVAKWLTPQGQDINKEGISPDQEVKLTYEDFENDLDPQLEAAINFFNK